MVHETLALARCPQAFWKRLEHKRKSGTLRDALQQVVTNTELGRAKIHTQFPTDLNAISRRHLLLSPQSQSIAQSTNDSSRGNATLSAFSIRRSIRQPCSLADNSVPTQLILPLVSSASYYHQLLWRHFNTGTYIIYLFFTASLSSCLV